MLVSLDFGETSGNADAIVFGDAFAQLRQQLVDFLGGIEVAVVVQVGLEQWCAVTISQTLDPLQGKHAVGSGLLTLDAQLVFERADEFFGTTKGTGNVVTDLEDYFANLVIVE